MNNLNLRESLGKERVKETFGITSEKGRQQIEFSLISTERLRPIASATARTFGLLFMIRYGILPTFHMLRRHYIHPGDGTMSLLGADMVQWQ